MNLLNIFAVSLIYCLILTSLTRKSFRLFLRLFFVCSVVYLFFMMIDMERYFTLPITLICSLMIKSKNEKYLYSLLRSQLAMLIFTLFMFTLGYLIYLLSPDFMEYQYYDVLISVLSIIFGVIVFLIALRYNILRPFFYGEKFIKAHIVMESILLIIVSLVLPLVLATDESRYTHFNFYFLFMVSIIIAFYFFYYLTVFEIKIKTKQSCRRYEEIQNRFIIKKHQDIVAIKHYHNKLYQIVYNYITNEDWNGFKECYAEYITPLYESHIQSDIDVEKLEAVKLPLIKKLLVYSAIMARPLYNVSFTVDITDEITDCFISELDLFIILNEWITNAFQAVENNEGFVHVFISNSLDDLTVKVYNPVYSEIDITKIYEQSHTTKSEHSGIGLTNVKNIIDSYSTLEHMTDIELDKFVQSLIIRRG